MAKRLDKRESNSNYSLTMQAGSFALGYKQFPSLKFPSENEFSHAKPNGVNGKKISLAWLNSRFRCCMLASRSTS